MAALKKKDDDMRAMEERYKMYLEKARNVSVLCVGVLVLTPVDQLWAPFVLIAGDPSTRPQTESSNCRDSDFKEPTGRAGQTDRQPGSESEFP